MSTTEEEAGGASKGSSAVELEEVASSATLTSAAALQPTTGAPRRGLMRAIGRSKTAPLALGRTAPHSEGSTEQEFEWADWWRWIPGVSLALHFYYFDVTKESALLYYEALALVTTLLLGSLAGMSTAYTMEDWLDFEDKCEADYNECFDCREEVKYFGESIIVGGNALYMSLFCIFLLYVTLVLGRPNDDAQFAKQFRATLPVQIAPLLLTLFGLFEFSTTLEIVTEVAMPNYAFLHNNCYRKNRGNFEYWGDVWRECAVYFVVITAVWISVVFVRYRTILIHEPKPQQ